ncbi:MAG: hypothetical protein RMI94_05525 [Bryobacterales bacterium]|nr:hypothetical protein [Bryobacteraceae bacterium]MDW8129990.1 hypothetical protein [Bryobacterales bacterium]
MPARAIACSLALVLGGILQADFSYRQTSRFTGGMMTGAMKVAAALSKQATEPLTTTYLLKGNRLAMVSQRHAEIVDLDKATVTHVDFERKTYSVMTFAEMAELLQQAETRLARDRDEPAEIAVKVSVEPTDQIKPIAGMDARMVRLRVDAEKTDKKSGKREPVMTMISEQWIAAVPGYGELRDFYRRVSERIPWVPSARFLPAQRPEEARAVAELRKHAAALDGLAIFELTRTYMTGGEAGALKGEEPEERSPEPQPSVGGALGRLGGLGRLGRLGRPKDTPQQPPAPQPAQGTRPAETLLMEITAEASGFSTAPVDPSRLEVPAGFRQVENELRRMRR